MKPKLFIRTDGNSQIGLGHLVRCTALAHMLKDDFEITFICRLIPNGTVSELKGEAFGCIKIKKEAEFFEQLTSNSIVVLDGYHFDTAYQKQIKSKGAKLVCIDDLHNKEFFADLIINHAPGITTYDYQAQPYTQFALGLDFVLLRPAFLKQAKNQRRIEKIETVLICFGGSDPKNLTQSVLQVVVEFPQFKKIIIVTGGSYYMTNSFKKLIVSENRIEHLHSLNEQQILSAMLESDLAIVPASGILFEVLAVGCIVITGSYINNQDFILKGFLNLKAVIESSNLSKPRDTLLRVISDTQPHRKSLIDGESKNRIINKITSLLN